MDENKNLNNQPEKEEEKKKKKCGFLVWWHKLSKGAKIGISAAAGVALTSAIVFPTLAATVWSSTEIKFNLGKDKKTFTLNNISLSKGKKYTFKLNVDSLKNYETTGFQFAIFDLDGQEIKTKECASNIIFKSNKQEFKKLVDAELPSAHQYSYIESNNKTYFIGANSFSSTENVLYGNFSAEITIKNAGIVFVTAAA